MTADRSVPPLRRVLVADDEHLVGVGLAASVSDLGLEVIGPAADGQATIELARTSHPDLALLDIKMPEKDGVECARALWDEMALPTVIVSAYSSEAYVKKSTEAGVFGYLLKPVSTDSLRAALNVAWERAQTLAESQGRVTQLEHTLASRRVVELAKWRMIEALGISEDVAHRTLQRAARSQRRRVTEVAQIILDTEPDQWRITPVPAQDGDGA